MPDPHISGRALAAALGVDEKAVRNAVRDGRIRRESDGKFDLVACRSTWAANSDPARSRLRTAADPPHRPQPDSPQVRTPRSAPLPPADAPALWAALDYLVALVPWAVAGHGGSLQLAFDIHADLSLDLPAELRRRGFSLPGAMEAIDWPGLANEMGLALIAPSDLAASYARRRAEG